MTTPTATPPVGSMTIPSPRQQFIDTLRREHKTTQKIIDAFPPEQAEFTPHPRSSKARQLVWTFAVEEYWILAALRNQLNLRAPRQKTPESWAEVRAVFDENHTQLMAALESARDDEFAGTVQFFTGPGAIADVAKLEFMWFMLGDQIHHRGQMSVYLRMAGGKVPSIYGPSADEPWF